MKKIFYTIGTVITIGLFTACETVVEVEMPERDSKLVLNSLFSPDSSIVVTLSASKGILEAGDLEHVNNGRITVSGSDGSYAQVSGTGSGTQPSLYYYYHLPLKAKAHVTYTVKASAPGFGAVSATDQLPGSVAIDKTDTSTLRLFDSEEKQVSITFSDPGNDKNFYETRLYYLVYQPVYDSTGQVIGMMPWVGDLPSYISSEGLFSEGIDESVFTDDLFNGRSFTVQLAFDESIYSHFGGDSIPVDFPVFLIAELRSVSENYYKFTSSYLRYQSSSGDPFAQPVQVFNNVEGGFGIFAGYSFSRDTMQVH